MLGLLAGCSGTVEAGGTATGPSVASDSGSPAAAGSQGTTSSARPAAATSAARTSPPASACSSTVLLAWVRERFHDASTPHVIASVRVARCRNGYAHVLTIPRQTKAGQAELEGEQLFLQRRGGVWTSVLEGTGPACSDPEAGRDLVRACAALGYRTTARLPRISDPQVAADRLVAAWLQHDPAAAGQLTLGGTTIEDLFSHPAPATAPRATPCRPAALGSFSCDYALSPTSVLSVLVDGGASAGYVVRALTWRT